MKKSKTFKIVCIILAVIAALFLFYLIAGIGLALVFDLGVPPPPEPQIKYGEFPFSITYEVDGEIKTYEDVVICEYVGIKNLGTNGKRREWSRRLESGNERIVLMSWQENDLTFEITQAIPGKAEYYMGDRLTFQSIEDHEQDIKNEKYLVYRVREGDRTIEDNSITEEQAWEKYRLRILNIVWSRPIENTFEK